MDDYLGNEPLDDLNKFLFTLASYNAGPGAYRLVTEEEERRTTHKKTFTKHP